ncbi:motility associated factor glycosyltransferase family protein [Thiomicrorhabdus lithotrophica]|uniref:DUF115 domain-containing protein n=1 Tax=Thiomicrorhabdus lithotrophica TaxID=2949997 RepID=A0ABY8CBK9_9GAMM|nr:6-hydroxymethylpterin diphosphokinase MptE-like protein [Thiomicrorhabdus lithotrophica]WEJ63366.1 DUF115 domain-containing protein [Thiomicrorhabdus lithotrophica]
MQGITLSDVQENKFGEKYFSEINHLAFETLSSDVIFNKLYSNLLDKEEHLYIIVGTDSGLLFKHFQNKELPKNLKLIFVEFSEVIQATGLLESGTELWEGNVRLVTPDFNFGRIGSAFNSYVLRRKIDLIKSLGVIDAQSNSAYRELWTQMEVAFNAFRRSEFNAQSTRVFEIERVLNAADNIIPVRELANTLQGRDVVVLGGGPTLDDSIDWLRENQHRLVIFAAARIAKRLINESIVADFYVTVDPFDWSFDNSKSVMACADESVLIHSFHAQHKIVSQWNGLATFSGARYGWKVEGELPNIETPGPTVTNSAMHIACSLGANRVFLSGIDFCFAHGLTHESGSEEAKVADTFGFNTRAKLEDNAGNLTETSDDFYGAWQSMESSVKLYQAARKIDIFNLGLHSAKIKGVEYISCEDVTFQKEDKIDLTQLVRDKLKLSVEDKFDFAKKTVKDLQVQLKRFSKLQKLAHDGHSVAGKLYDEKTLEPRDKQMIRVQKLRKKIDNLVAEDGDMIMNYQAKFFYDSFKPVEDESNMSPKEIEEQLKAFFSGVEKLSEHFVDAIKDGIKRAELRRDELSQKVLPSALFSQWEKWHEFGRSEQWLKWHPDTELNSEEQAVLDKALKNYQNEYEKQDHNYSNRVQKRISNVSTLLTRAEKAYDNKDIEELNGLIKHSKTLDAAKESQKQSFIFLLEGMLDEILDKPESAMQSYLQVEMPSLRHKALKRALTHFMNTKNYEQSMLVLEQLCSFSLEYMVPYSDMLNMMGQKISAAQILQMYLTQHPEHYAIQNKMAQLLMDLGETEAALATANFVLENEPTDKTALHIKQELSIV